MAKNINTSDTIPDVIIWGENGKALINWLRQQENELRDEGIDQIKNGEVVDGTNKILKSTGVSDIIESVEAMRRGIEDRERMVKKKIK